RQTLHFPPVLWPGTLRFGNYATTIRQSAFGTWFWNTTVVTVAVVISNLVLCSLAAYAFARIRFLGRGVVYFLLLATLMVPLQVGLATFQGAHNTQWQLVAAANVMSMIPVVILFLAAQRFFVRGIATQGLKG